MWIEIEETTNSSFFSYCLCHTHQYLTLLLKEREDDRCVTAPPEVLDMVLAWMFRA